MLEILETVNRPIFLLKHLDRELNKILVILFLFKWFGFIILTAVLPFCFSALGGSECLS